MMLMPGDVFGNRKPIGVFFGEPLKVFDDVEQIARRGVARIGSAHREEQPAQSEKASAMIATILNIALECKIAFSAVAARAGCSLSSQI